MHKKHRIIQELQNTRHTKNIKKGLKHENILNKNNKEKLQSKSKKNKNTNNQVQKYQEKGEQRTTKIPK